MTASEFEQARKWAYRRRNISDARLSAGVKAAAELILTLPDTIVDGDQLREVIANWDNRAITSDAYTLYQQVLALLPAPPSLPTLEELIEAGNEVEDYQWAWVDTEQGVQVISMAGAFDDKQVYVTDKDGYQSARSWSEVRPRPEPRLEWPGDDVRDAPNVDNESTLPRPEDVPAREVWIVRHEGEEWVGVRADQDKVSWSIISMDGMDYRDVDDSEVILVSRLVPKTH